MSHEFSSEISQRHLLFNQTCLRGTARVPMDLTPLGTLKVPDCCNHLVCVFCVCDNRPSKVRLTDKGLIAPELPQPNTSEEVLTQKHHNPLHPTPAISCNTCNNTHSAQSTHQTSSEHLILKRWVVWINGARRVYQSGITTRWTRLVFSLPRIVLRCLIYFHSCALWLYVSFAYGKNATLKSGVFFSFCVPVNKAFSLYT